MKKLTRRQLFKGAGAIAVGGAALAVGLTPAKAVSVGIGACSRFGKSYSGLYPTWTPEFHLPRNILRLSLKRAVQLIEADGTVSTYLRLKRNNPAGAG